MIKKLLLSMSFFCLSCFTYSQNKIDTLKVNQLDEIMIFSSIKNNPQQEPVSLSTVDKREIDIKLSNQEFPEILKTTPSVFATKQGGGIGDSRITLRGFSSDNIAVLINGVPINGAENGAVFWSNWSGLSDVTRIIQVQRGIGLSTLGLYSVGGTINIATIPTNKTPMGSVFYGIGNDNYQKRLIDFSSGEDKRGWATSFMLSNTSGDGYVKGTNFEAWSYLVNISKKINNQHKFLFTALGVNQWHNRRSNKHYISDYENYHDGIKANTDFGYIDGQLTPTSSGYNQYHKPQISLSHFWTIDKKNSLTTVVYGSMSSGGGKKVYGDSVNLIQYNYKTGQPYSSTNLTPYGQIDYTNVMNINRNSLTGSKAIFTMATNDHDWYGIISTFKHEFDKNWTLSCGIDGRYYKGYHYEEITDLLGGSYFLDNKLAWRDSSIHLKVGDKVNYDNIAYITNIGSFAQLQYNKNRHNAFLSLTATDYMYKINNPGRYGEYGNQTLYPKEDVESETQIFLPYGIKCGYNYEITKHQKAFINGGYVTRAPWLDNTFSDNTIVDNATMEKITTVEIGYGLYLEKFFVQINAYYTDWADKTTSKLIGGWNGSKAFIPNIDALHKGVELEFNYIPLKELRVNGFFSVGSWKWTNDVDFELFDENYQSVGTYNAYIKDLHVGNAPQTSAALSFTWECLKNLNIGGTFVYYDRYYADFDPTNRILVNDRSDSWELPSFYTLDLNINYRINVNKTNIDFYANVNNLFDEKYISDATDGISHNKETALVWYGFGRTWTCGVKVSF